MRRGPGQVEAVATEKMGRPSRCLGGDGGRAIPEGSRLCSSLDHARPGATHPAWQSGFGGSLAGGACVQIGRDDEGRQVRSGCVVSWGHLSKHLWAVA